MDYPTLLQILASTVRLGVPLLLACLAGLFSERAGIFDIGLEGKMLMAAFAAGAFASVSGSVWVGLLAAIAASVMLAVLHGLAAITFRGNQLISGVAINFLASGLTVLVGQEWFQLGGKTPALDGAARFGAITLPFADALQGLPVIGPFYHDVMSGHSILVYVAFIALVTPHTHLLDGVMSDSGLLDIVKQVATWLVLPLVGAAIFSQFSAAIADTIGGTGNVRDRTDGKVSERAIYAVILSVALILAWSADTAQVLVLASKAFAFYYGLQCAVAAIISSDTRIRLGATMLAAVMFAITVFAIPVG